MECKNCQHCHEDCVTSYFSGVMYWTNYCDLEEHRLKLIDADAERQCKNYKEVEICCGEIAQNAEA